MPNASATDSAGSTYVTGFIQGTVDFDPAINRPDGSDTLTPRGTSDVYVAKYNADNSFAWARRMGSDYVRKPGDAYEAGNAIKVDGAGNVHVAGSFFGQADFGTARLTSAGDADAFVTKLDRNGNILWAKGWGSSDQDVGNDLAVDSSGNVVSVGTSAFADSVTAGQWHENTSQVRKYSPTGAAVWNQAFAGPTCGAYGVTTDATGNIYMCGRFSGTIDFNSAKGKVNSATGNYGSAYVLKLSPAGAFGWVSSFESRPTDKSYGSGVTMRDIVVDAGGNVIVGGQFQGQIDLDPSSAVDYRLPDTRRVSAFVAKLTPSGSLAWARLTGGDYVSALALNASGAIYVTGYYVFSDFTPATGPAVAVGSGAPAYVSKFTASGTEEWALTTAGTANGMSVDSAGTITLVGSFGVGTKDFDPDPLTTHEVTNTAFTDLYILRLKQK
jgi:hypothetical protein